MSWAASEKIRVRVVEFQYTRFNGTANELVGVRICDTADPLELEGNTYIPDPDLTIELPTLDGSAQDFECRINLADKFTDFRTLVSGRAHPVLRVRVREFSWDPADENNGDAFVQVLWDGNVDFAHLNKPNKDGILELTIGPCGGRKDRNPFPVATSNCWKTFGDQKTCTVDTGPLIETVTVDAVDRYELTISGATTPSLNYWERGKAFIHGITINIEQWTRGTPDRFVLSRLVPATFQDFYNGVPTPQTIQIEPGCSRTPGDCFFYQGDTVQFQALGLRMAPNHPVYELR